MFKKFSKTLTYSSFQNVELPKYLKVVLWVEILLLKESILGWLQSFCMETTAKSSGVVAYSFPGIPLLLLHIVPKMQRKDRKFTVWCAIEKQQSPFCVVNRAILNHDYIP